MIKKLDDDLFSNGDIIFYNEDSNYVTFFSDEMVILGVDLNIISLDDINFNEDDPKTIIHVRLTYWRNRFKQCKGFKKDRSRLLMSVAWHLTRWWDCCMSEDEKKEIKPFLIDEK